MLAMLAFMRVQPPVIRIAIVRRACGFREIVSAVGGSAIDSDAGTLRSKRNEFDRDDIGEAEYRRARYADGAPVLKLGNHQDRCRLDDRVLPIFAQLVPGHIKYRARHVCGGAVTRRAAEIAGPRQGPTEISDAYRLVGARRSGAASAARRLRLPDADNARWDGVALGDQTPGPARHNTQIFRGRRSADALERLFATALLVYR